MNGHGDKFIRALSRKGRKKPPVSANVEAASRKTRNYLALWEQANRQRLACR